MMVHHKPHKSGAAAPLQNFASLLLQSDYILSPWIPKKRRGKGLQDFVENMNHENSASKHIHSSIIRNRKTY